MSGLCIQRLSNGQVSASLSNMRGESIGMIGAFEGDAQIVIGNNSSGNDCSELYIAGNSGTNINVTDASKDMSFWGSGLGVEVTDQDNESNIEWNASNGSLSYEYTSRAAQLQIGSSAHDNQFTFGWGDAQIFDYGDYNYTQLGSGTSYYASMASNTGAVVLGGSGNATYQIAGNYGIFGQGSGYSTYQINSDAQVNDGVLSASYGEKNAIFSNSSSAIIDNGARSYISQQGSNSTLKENGYRSIADVANSTTVTMGEDAYRSYVFAGGATSTTVVDGGESFTFDRDSQLYRNGWSNNWSYNTTSGKYDNTDYYNSTSGHSNHITGQWLTLSGALDNVLASGDEGAEKNKSYKE